LAKSAESTEGAIIGKLMGAKITIRLEIGVSKMVKLAKKLC
jgi:hypothetical protein